MPFKVQIMLIGLSDMRDDLLKLHANGGMETG